MRAVLCYTIVMNNQPQGKWPDPVKPIGTGEGESPLAKSPQQGMEARTMASDIKSVSESGGSGTPHPYTPQPAPPRAVPPPSPPFQPPPAPLKNIPFTQAPKPPQPSSDMSGGFPPPPPRPPSSPFPPPRPATPQPFPPQKPPAPLSQTPPSPKSAIFSPPTVETMQTQTGAPKEPQEPASMGAKKKGGRVILYVSIGIIVLAALGYFIVYPMFSSSPAEEVSAVPVPPVETAPETQPTPEQEAEPIVVPPPELLYTSLFSRLPVASTTIDATPFALSTWKIVLNGTSTTHAAFSELILTNEQRALSAATFFSGVLPGILSEDTVAAFVQDVTVFLYRDTNGIWPGVVARIRDTQSTNAETIKSSFRSDFEKASPSTLANLYTSDPGTSQTWKQGQTGSVLNRYLIFNTGDLAVSLNYGWSNNTLLISTSYDGFKEALKYLQ